MVRQRERRTVPVGEHGATLYPRIRTEREQRLIAAPCLPYKRPDNAHKRMLVVALPSPGNGRHDVELRYSECLGHVCLMLPEKAPKHGSEPKFQPPPHYCVRVVLVVPEFVRELSSLHRERDRDDDVSESPTVHIVSSTARVTEPVSGIDRRPADGTPRPGGRTEMRWLRYGSLSSKTVATDGQAQTRSVDSDASRCTPSNTSAADSTTVTPGRCA